MKAAVPTTYVGSSWRSGMQNTPCRDCHTLPLATTRLPLHVSVTPASGASLLLLFYVTNP